MQEQIMEPATLRRIPAGQRRGLQSTDRNWKAYDHAFDLAVKEGLLVDEFVMHFKKPLTKYDDALYCELQLLWRKASPGLDWNDFPTRREDYVSEEEYRSALFASSSFRRALREKDNRMFAWLEKCFPGHDH